MELIEVLKDLINTVGVNVALIIYFCWRDVKYMGKLDETLNTILTTLNYIVERKE